MPFYVEMLYTYGPSTQKYTQTKVGRFYNKHDANYILQETIPIGLPISEKIAIALNNDRQRRGKWALEAVMQYENQLITKAEMEMRIALSSKPIDQTRKLPSEKTAYSCSRFDRIRDYLLKNRQELASDSMTSQMPEHTLHNYIQMRGGIVLHSDEWRSFLQVCNAKNIFFKSISPTYCQCLTHAANPTDMRHAA